MKIGFYKWAETDEATKSRILRRAQADIQDVSDKIKQILENVRLHGDRAVIDYARQFDKAELTSLKVSQEELDEAESLLDAGLKAALDRCIGNVRRFHEEQMRRVEDRWMFEIEPGVWGGEQINPVSSLGLYVPGGKNLYPSSVYMLAVPAVVAKVPKVIMVTPPRPDGNIAPALLYTAQKSGITEIYKAGGAVAIAAMAYGTETVPSVRKVIGPCSPFGAAAKQLLSGIIDPGMPAGPSESLILCDETADRDNTILDILNEAEHGPDASGLLVTHDETLAKYVYENLPREIAKIPEPQRGYLEFNMANYSGVILTGSLEESIAFSNLYAPEHVMLKIKDAENYLDQMKNAGEILIGENTPSTLGNFSIGTTHVLPTGGMAHSHSCTSVWDYLKRTSLAKVDAQGLNSLMPSAVAIADYEGFPAHGNVLRQRKIYNS
jgi:histidinol dehydrogenase